MHAHMARTERVGQLSDNDRRGMAAHLRMQLPMQLFWSFKCSNASPLVFTIPSYTHFCAGMDSKMGVFYDIANVNYEPGLCHRYFYA